MMIFPAGVIAAQAEVARGRPASERFWAVVFHGAMGLGFLCKGPIILLLVGLTVVPYLVVTRRLVTGARRLAVVWGLLLFLALALSWPARVLALDPNAWGVWMTEIGQKTGNLPIAHRQRAILGLELPALSLPWSVMAVAGIALPLVRNRRVKAPWRASSVWFAWWWVAGNLVVFSTWAVAKPNYFLPCLPGLALLAGMAWIRLNRVARAPAWSVATALARLLLGRSGWAFCSWGFWFRFSRRVICRKPPPRGFSFLALQPLPASLWDGGSGGRDETSWLSCRSGPPAPSVWRSAMA